MVKNILCLSLFIIISSLTAFSQIRIGIEAGGNNVLGIIRPQIIGPYNYGSTFTLSGKYLLKDKFGFGLSTGLYYYLFKTSDVTKNKLTKSVVPILLSTEYNFTGRKLRPFFGLDFGLFIHRDKREIGENKIDNIPSFTIKYSGTYFGGIPSFGLRYLFNEYLSANIALKYICVFFPQRTFSNANLSIGVNYTFK